MRRLILALFLFVLLGLLPGISRAEKRDDFSYKEKSGNFNAGDDWFGKKSGTRKKTEIENETLQREAIKNEEAKRKATFDAIADGERKSPSINPQRLERIKIKEKAAAERKQLREKVRQEHTDKEKKKKSKAAGKSLKNGKDGATVSDRQVATPENEEEIEDLAD